MLAPLFGHGAFELLYPNSPRLLSSTRSGGLAERPARWRSLYFMVVIK